MQGSYPLARCPYCKKGFRWEVKGPVAPRVDLGRVLCPHCGLKFQRFNPQYLRNSAPKQVLGEMGIQLPYRKGSQAAGG